LLTANCTFAVVGGSQIGLAADQRATGPVPQAATVPLDCLAGTLLAMLSRIGQ
jgi:hypothetical protein